MLIVQFFVPKVQGKISQQDTCLWSGRLSLVGARSHTAELSLTTQRPDLLLARFDVHLDPVWRSLRYDLWPLPLLPGEYPA
jgi:hypothetical protein